MNLNDFHFAQPLWLWAFAIVPMVWVVFLLYEGKKYSFHQLEKMIDKHLLPYLLVNSPEKKKSLWKALVIWSLVWCGLTLAIAGPRWSFREIETFSRDQSLVILLDLSESMNATDIKPSRLVRAKQKIEDLLNASQAVKIGLVAFAADPHMISPITDDKETIRHLLPSVTTELVFVQGSRLSSALEMAVTMLGAEPGNNKAILVISDGGFEDGSAISTTKKIADKGIVIYAMGVGSSEGAPIKDREGATIKKNGSIILSKLEEDKLVEISNMGKGKYLKANYSNDEVIILKDLEKLADAQMEIGKMNRQWDEGFYVPLLAILPLVLVWFRRGHIIAIFLLFFSHSSLHASFEEYFMNSEERGKQAYENGDYQTAIESFQDTYRKGVASYKAGNYEDAEKLFRQCSREEIATDAEYNLGNSLVQQQKFKEAITAYEDLLKKHPEHTKAKENLELIKKLQEQQKQDKSDNSDQQDKDNSDDDEDKNEGSDNNKDKNQKSENSDKDQDKNDDSNSEKDKDKEDQEQQNDNQEDQDNEEQQDSQNEQEQKSDEEQSAMNDGEEEQNAEADEQETDAKSQQDHDADMWLNRIKNDPKQFLKNKFYIESKKNGTTEAIDPW